MDLNEITPVILTYNEAPNIARNLERLGWAREVVVVDSGSQDQTQALVGSFPNTRLIVRPFDSHARQWTFAVHETNVATPWVLRLDADYIVPTGTIEEMRRLVPGDDVGGYRVAFDYCIDGRRLRASLYPDSPVLLRRDRVSFVQDGHTERAKVTGTIGRLVSHFEHDDRKGLDRWLSSQFHYQRREAEKLLSTPWDQLSWADRIRRTRVLGPPLVLLYCLFGRGLILDGWPGWQYALQRMTADMILSMLLIQRTMPGGSPEPDRLP